MTPGLVIVGGSYAGLNIAAAARAAGYARPISLLSEEAYLPYQRPPLSKDFLTGKVDISQLPIRSAGFFEEQKIGFLSATKAVRVDRSNRLVYLMDGGALEYDKLAFATGCRPRRLDVPGAELEGIHYLRSLDDALKLRDGSGNAHNVAVVGGGFIGLEIAASLRRLGKAVTVIEAQSRLMARALPESLSGFFADRHKAEGVNLMFEAQVAAFGGVNGRLSSLQTVEGRTMPVDMAIIGIGVIPNSELAAESGLKCENGIVVDDFATTEDPNIMAAGDCTSHNNPFAVGRVRLESVQNAVDQGKVAGRRAAGVESPYSVPPWFWSDQYDLKLQGVGLSTAYEQQVARGDPNGKSFSYFYFRDGQLAAVDSINKPADHLLARKLLAARVSPTLAQAADLDFNLANLLTQ